MKKTKRERSIEGKIYTLIMKKLNIGPKNAIVGSNNYTL